MKIPGVCEKGKSLHNANASGDHLGNAVSSGVSGCLGVDRSIYEVMMSLGLGRIFSH